MFNVHNSDITPLQHFSGETWLSFPFYLTQFLYNFFKYSFSNFLLSYSNKIFAIYFSSNLLLLNSLVFEFNLTFHIFSILSCLLTSASIFPSNLFINFFAFSKFFSFFHILFSIINPFYFIKYFITPLTFCLFQIFSTSHSSILFTSTGFSFSTL